MRRPAIAADKREASAERARRGVPWLRAAAVHSSSDSNDSNDNSNKNSNKNNNTTSNDNNLVDAAGHIRARRECGCVGAWVRAGDFCGEAARRRGVPYIPHPRPSPSPHALTHSISLSSPSLSLPSSPHLTSHLTLSRNAAHAQCKPPAMPTPQHVPMRLHAPDQGPRLSSRQRLGPVARRP
jgi:hypothetical protein